MQIEQDSAQVAIPPPLMLLSCVLLGVGLHWIYPLPFVGNPVRWIAAAFLICTGIGTILYCAWKFKKTGTNIEPWKKTSRIITSGVYRFTRNPIYLSFLVVGTGVAFAVNSAWIIAMMLPLVFLLTHFVIAKEERYLEQSFGSEYLAYKKKVRRWF